MTHPWLKHYAPGTPATVDVLAYPNLPALIEQACQRYADLPAFTAGDTTLRYADIDRLSRCFAGWLQRSTDLQPGDRIALMMPNLLQYPVALLGAWRAGLVVVNVNPMYTARELSHQLRDSGASAIVALDSLLPLIRQVRGETALRYVLATAADDLQRASEGEAGPVGLVAEQGEYPLRQVLDAAYTADFKPPVVSREDLALLQYTGGTTGVSKGAMLSHGNMVANVLQGAAWYGSFLTPGAEQVVTVIPLYHIFALSLNALVMMYFGAHNRLIVSGRDMPALLAALRAGCSVFSGVNTLYNGLLNEPRIADINMRGVKLAISGGVAAQPAVVERWEQLTGYRIVEGYGLTETSPLALSNPLHLRYGGGLLPLPSTEVAVRDDQGQELPTGQVGEICIRGPQVMQGYWQQPAETAAVLSSDGWLRTGDVGFMDERGAFTVTDRKKDMVLVSGFNVFPNEVEAVLAQHPGVLESAVIGVADERTGEAVKAFVVPRDASVSADDLIAHCRATLTAYKVPKQIELVEQLPKSAVGKILRRQLRS
jgi:long-chain acyl-CoA synthetase